MSILLFEHYAHPSLVFSIIFHSPTFFALSLISFFRTKLDKSPSKPYKAKLGLIFSSQTKTPSVRVVLFLQNAEVEQIPNRSALVGHLGWSKISRSHLKNILCCSFPNVTPITNFTQIGWKIQNFKFLRPRETERLSRSDIWPYIRPCSSLFFIRFGSNLLWG